MANLPNTTKEQIVEIVEDLFIMGIKEPLKIWRVFKKECEKRQSSIENIPDIKTIRNYVDIVRRRIRNRYKRVNLNNVLKEELRDLDYIQKQLWDDYRTAFDPKDRVQIIRAIIDCKERKAKLLGLDTENKNPAPAKTLEDLIKEDDEKNEQTTDRGPVLDPGQAGPKSEVPAQQNTELPGQKPDGA